MKLLFSEAKSDYANYIFPYVIWAILEPGETPAQLFAAGFLPSSSRLDRFYLCRHLRVDLARYHPSSENRRVLRKGAGLASQLVPRADFAYTGERRDFFLRYADTRFGTGVMTRERLDTLFDSPVISHLLVFTDSADGREVGVVALHLEPPTLAFYYYAFYDLGQLQRSLGMFMMTTAAGWFAEHGFRHLYLGTCYTPGALYKTQFAGVEFFNGVRWSGSLAELKYLIHREQEPLRQHLLETAAYRADFFNGDFAALVKASPFSLALPK